MAVLPAEKAVSWRFLLSPHQWIRASAGCACHRTSLGGRGTLCRNRAPATREKSERIQVITRGNCGFFSLFNLWSRALYLVGAAGQGWNKKSGTVSCSHLMVSKKWWMNWNLAKTMFWFVNDCCVGFSHRSCTFSKSCQRICTFGSKQAIYLTHQGLGRVEPSGEEVSLLCFVPPQVQPLPPDVTLWYCTRFRCIFFSRFLYPLRYLLYRFESSPNWLLGLVPSSFKYPGAGFPVGCIASPA